MDIWMAFRDTPLKHGTYLVSMTCKCVLTGVAHCWCWLCMICLSCVLTKPCTVSQTAGGALRGDVHLKRSFLTTRINHQSNFIFLHCHLNLTLRAHA